jgi:hypothetical protein
MASTMRGASANSRSASAERGSASRTTDSKFATREKADNVTGSLQKLRRIRASLGRQQGLDRAVSAVPGAAIRRALYRQLGVDEGARHLTPETGIGPSQAATGPRPRPRRQPVPVLGALLIATIVGAGLTVVYNRTQFLALADAPVAPPAAVAAVVPANAEALPVLPKAVQPESVWLVENGSGSELYSNGLRIETTFETVGDPRRFRVFRTPTGEMGPAQTEPVGILFHTSESDIWPLDEANNERLRVSSQRLMQYIQRRRLYHYVIDRFGRVFRAVQEGGKANHAGNSIWTRGDEVYLNLNHAFFGVCFETRWEGGQALPITQAQLAAGRNLTDYLRHRYSIAGDLCVTHGLTSVNPKKHLIGHHVDWARGFPFDAFGLPDQYERPAPSVGLFGFGYDEPFLTVMGEPWKGVRHAEQALSQEAARLGRTVDEVRREKQAMYDRWIGEQARDDQEAQRAQAPSAPAPHQEPGGKRNART